MAFSTPDAKRTVLVALTLTAVVSLVHDVASKKTPDVPRLLIGSILAGVFLMLVADPLPEAAAMLAVLVLISTLLQSGPVVVAAATTRLTPKGGTLA